MLVDFLELPDRAVPARWVDPLTVTGRSLAPETDTASSIRRNESAIVLYALKKEPSGSTLKAVSPPLPVGNLPFRCDKNVRKLTDVLTSEFKLPSKMTKKLANLHCEPTALPPDSTLIINFVEW